jgi:ornithine carbamoyltransferase
MARDFLSLNDLTADEISAVLKRAAEMKAARSETSTKGALAGKSVGLIFNKPSMRTLVSFRVGVYELGGHAVHLPETHTQFSSREPISHAARVLSRYLHMLVVRTFAQAEIEEWADYADIPVINALTDLFHPCQVLSDMLTVIEKKGGLKNRVIAWVGDGNNMANSWINAAALMGFELRLAAPEGYDPDPAVLEAAKNRKADILVTRNPAEAVKDADVIYTDVWASMGQESEAKARAEIFKPYQVNNELTDHAPDAVVLHCLPAHLGEEITEEVVEGPQSAVIDQAENRLHAQKALMEFLIQG